MAYTLKVEARLNSILVHHFNDDHPMSFEFMADGTYKTYNLNRSGDVDIAPGQRWKLSYGKAFYSRGEDDSHFKAFWGTPEYDRQLYLVLREWQEVDSILLDQDSETN